MRNAGTPAGVTPGSSVSIQLFMKVYDELCPTGDDEVSVDEFAARIGWQVERVVEIAWWCFERRLIDCDAEMGGTITTIEGVYR